MTGAVSILLATTRSDVMPSAVNGRCVTASESKAIRRGQAGMLALQSLQRQAAAAAEFYVGRIGSVAAAAEAFNG